MTPEKEMKHPPNWPDRLWITNEGSEGDYWRQLHEHEELGATEFLSLAEHQAILADEVERARREAMGYAARLQKRLLWALEASHRNAEFGLEHNSSKTMEMLAISSQIREVKEEIRALQAKAQAPASEEKR